MIQGKIKTFKFKKQSYIIFSLHLKVKFKKIKDQLFKYYIFQVVLFELIDDINLNLVIDFE